MATPVEIENQIQNLNDILDALNNAQTISPTQFRANGKTYTQAQLDKEVSDLQKDINTLTKLIKPYTDAKAKLQSASATGPGQQMTEVQRGIVAKAQQQVNAAAAKAVKIPVLVSRLARPVQQGKPISTENALVTNVRRGVTGPTGPATTTTIGAKVTGPTGAKTTGPSAPTTTTKKTTTPSKPAAGGGTTVVVDGEKVKVGGQRWQEIIQQEFGSLWDVYNGNADVKKVIDQSVKEGWFNDETKLTASLTNTGWFRTTQQSARQYAIRQSSDPAQLDAEINQQVEGLRASTTATGITLDDNTLRKLATDKVKFGWSAQQLSNAVGSEAIATAQLGGARGISDLRSGVVGRNLRQKAAAYAQKPSDSILDTWIQQIMRGEKSETQWEDLMRDSAKTQFRSLQPALDKGQDVETALYAYKQQAQATLGSAVDMSEIDWTSDKWNKALNYRDPKTNEYRQMDLWEWNKYLRSLPEWQNTDQAKDVYRNVAMGLAQGFGKMA